MENHTEHKTHADLAAAGEEFFISLQRNAESVTRLSKDLTTGPFKDIYDEPRALVPMEDKDEATFAAFIGQELLSLAESAAMDQVSSFLLRYTSSQGRPCDDVAKALACADLIARHYLQDPDLSIYILLTISKDLRWSDDEFGQAATMTLILAVGKAVIEQKQQTLTKTQ